MMGVTMMPMAGGAATVQIVEAAPSGKTVIDDSKAVVEMAPRNQWEVFVAGDFSFYDHPDVGAKGAENKARNKNFPTFCLVLQYVNLESMVVSKTLDTK